MKMEIEFIRTRDRLPQGGQECLIVPKDSDFRICQATYRGVPDYYFESRKLIIELDNVTHWAEIPKNPNRKLQIGKAIKRAREQAGMSQNTLAKRAGMNPVQLSKYELGKTDPQFQSIVTIADALGISVSKLTSMLDD